MSSPSFIISSSSIVVIRHHVICSTAIILVIVIVFIVRLPVRGSPFGPGQYRPLRCTILLRLLLISLLKSAYTTGLMAEFTM